MSVTRNTAWRSRKGVHFESVARDWLCRHGLQCLFSNFRCKSGEIDLIMRDGRMLVFVEVRYRAGRSHGGAIATVTSAKQLRLRNTARYFLMLHPEYRQAPCRFDVVGIVGRTREDQQVDWIRGAFH